MSLKWGMCYFTCLHHLWGWKVLGIKCLVRAVLPERDDPNKTFNKRLCDNVCAPRSCNVRWKLICSAQSAWRSNHILVCPLVFCFYVTVFLSVLWVFGQPYAVLVFVYFGLAAFTIWGFNIKKKITKSTDVCGGLGCSFITKVFSGDEIRALCRTLRFFHNKLRACLHGAGFVHVWDN